MAIIALPNLTTQSPNSPGLPKGAKALTKSDTDTYPMEFSLWVGVAGDVVVSPANGNADETFTMPAGSMVPIKVIAVKSTGTTASQLKAIY